MSQLKYIKRIASLVLVLSLVLFLVSCNKQTDIPYGDISDDVYLTVGNDITVTEKELYESYRKQGAQTLATMLDNVLFEEEINLVNKLLGDDTLALEDERLFQREELREETNKLALNTIFKNDDLELIATLPELHFQVAIEKYVDSLFTLDNSIDRAVLFNSLFDHLSDALENNDNLALYEFSEVLENLRLRLAQKIYAKNILLENVNDENHDEFVDDKAVINYYKNNIRNRHDVNVFYFSFRHVAEATAVLRQLGIKADAAGNWYEIPNLLDADIQTKIQAQDPDYAHVIEILNTLNISTATGTVYTAREYARFYTAYTPNGNRSATTGLPDVPVSNDQEVLQLFIDAYNIVNENRELQLVDGNIEYLNGTAYETLNTYEDLTKLGTTIRGYIYDTLSVDEEDENAKAFSSLRSSGSLRYLIFKLDEQAEIDLIDEEKDADNNEQWIEDLTEDHKALIEEWRNEVIEARLTQSYVSNKVNELLEETKLDIHDGVLRGFYEDSYAYEGTEKTKAGYILATVNDVEIKVRDFYNQMDKAFGASMALDLAVNKILLAKNKAENILSDEDMKGFENDFKDLINSFSANEFAQAGFPASVGRAKFLISVFGAETNQDAIELGFVIPELRSRYLADYELHYNDVYEKLATLTNKHQSLYKGVTTSHLLVFFDANGDGTPDNPVDYLNELDELTPGAKQEALDGILELITGANGIYEQLASDVDIADIKGGLGLLANEVNNSGRITLGNNTRDTWTDYAKLGLNLKFEDISSQITNTSNFTGFINEEGTLDPVYYNRALALHDVLIDQYDEAKNGLSHLDFYPYNEAVTVDGDEFLNEPLTTEILENVLMSDFGFHFILVTGVDYISTFDYDGSNDTNKNYEFEFEDKTYNIYNEEDAISASQIEYKLLGDTDPELGAAMPTSISRAFTKHFNPIFELYSKNNFMQRELFFNIVLAEGVEFADADNNLVFEQIQEVNKRQFFSYINAKDGFIHDENFEALYGDWFTVLEA